jgi:predicted PurR-regulated permease PerM
MIGRRLNGSIRTWLASALATAVILAVIAAVVYLWSGVGDSEISVAGELAMALGVLVALALGIGLMSLVFISSRRGYDEAGRKDC